jgi:hypothetical protein
MVRFKGKAAEAFGDRELDPARIAEIAADNGMGPWGAALLNGLVSTEVSHLGGFLRDGRLRILFEAHRFDKYTDGAYRESHPNISSQSWNRDLYWGGAAEYVRLQNAMALDEKAALKSASYGYPQMMGDEAWRLGYDSPAAMISAFADSAHVQIEGMVAFLRSKSILDKLVAFDIETVSHRYNGPGYAKNRHHLKLAAHIAQWAGLGPWCQIGGAGHEVRGLQIALNSEGARLATDGAFGPATGQALVDFQTLAHEPHPMEV